MKTKQRMLTGDRATSRLHIGHYVGSLENRVKLQHEYDSFIIIADVQALTTHFQHPEALENNVLDIAIDYLSTGIDPDISTIFVQSEVPQIAELTAFYSMLVMVNVLRHNPTIKSESAQYGFKDLSYGFLGYPVSQAADITFCKADLVPVGEDQLPVIEVTRKIVRRFNSLYRPVLIEPKTLMGSCSRLVGLDGKAKMSKSMGNAIFLSDNRETICDKVKTAITDPGRITLKDRGNPDVCVVNQYLRFFSPGDYDNICNMCKNALIGCTACKNLLTDNLSMLLNPIGDKRRKLEENLPMVREILYSGSQRAKAAGQETLVQVKEAMGMGYFQQDR